MTPPGYIRNFVTSRISPLLESRETRESIENLQTLGRLVTASGRLPAESQQLALTGSPGHSRALLRDQQGQASGGLANLLAATITRARGGDRASYKTAMELSFVLIHQDLAQGNHSQAGQRLQQFLEITREYAQRLEQNQQLSPQDRMRYLFAAARIARTTLARVEDDAEFRTQAQTSIAELRTTLGAMYEQIILYFQTIRQTNPQEAAPYITIALETAMRKGFLEQDRDLALQSAQALQQAFQQIPPPQAENEELRWVAQARRALEQDRAFWNQVASLAQNQPAESPVQKITEIFNGLGFQLLMIIAATIDTVNEEEAGTIRQRYQALEAIVTAMILSRPDASLSQILHALQSEEENTLEQEMERVSREHSDLNDLFRRARRRQSLSTLIRRAREAARHVDEFSSGAGRNLIPVILRKNQETLTHLRHQAESGTVEENFDPFQEFFEGVLNNFQGGLDSRPDHEVAALQGIFQVLSQTQEIIPGLELNAEIRGHAQALNERMQGFEFHAARIWHHLTSPSSLATLGVGILTSELLPAFWIHRAGEGGSLAVRGIELVNAGRLTTVGAAASGLGTGLAMSVIGSGTYNLERRSQGLSTHFGRDLAVSAAVNSLTFAATVPFSRWLGNRLATTHGEAEAMAGLNGWRRWALYGGTAAFGSTMGIGLNMGFRYTQTGEVTTSWDEVAENYLSILAWEGGAAGVRYTRSRLGIGSELRGRRPIEPIPIGEGDNPSILIRAERGLRGRLAGLGNFLLTNLGPHRARLVNAVADRLFEANPQLAPYRDFIARDIALKECANPGYLESIMQDDFALLRRNIPYVVEVGGSPRILFMPRPELGWNSDLATAFLTQILLSVPTDPHYLPRLLNPDPTRPVEIRLDPRHGRILGVEHQNFEEASDYVRIQASYDPESRTLTLPPHHGESDPVLLNLGPLQDAHQISPAPYRWDLRFLQEKVMARPLSPIELEYLRAMMGLITQSAELEIQINPRAGTIYVPHPEDPPDTLSMMVRLRGRFDPQHQTITLPPPHGEQGDVVIHLESGEIIWNRPETPPPPPEPAAPEPPPPTPEPTPPSPEPTPPAASPEPRPPEGTSHPPPATSASAPEAAPVDPDSDPTPPWGTPAFVSAPEGSTTFTIIPLRPGDSLRGTEHDAEGMRRATHLAVAEGFGEIGAFTHEGISKHHPARNEDAYGIARSDNGLLLLVADGMGGEGRQNLMPGERASGRAVEVITGRFGGDGFDLAEAFTAAHNAIMADRHGGGTVATALHIRPDGSPRIAYTGDTRCFIARLRPDGSYEVFEAYHPVSVAGLDRMHHGPRSGFDTLTMHTHPASSVVLSALGTRSGGANGGAVVQDLSILRSGPGGEWINEPFRFQTGDLALLVSDGVAELFNRRQLGETLHGRTRIEEILTGTVEETQYRLNLYRDIAATISNGSRVLISEGSFAGRYINSDGNIFDAPTDGNLVGHVQPDNVALVAFRYDPNAGLTPVQPLVN